MPEKEDEVDLEWESLVEAAGPDARTPWHTVRHDETKPLKCWADDYYPDGTPHGCFSDATTELGLCQRHQEEVV